MASLCTHWFSLPISKNAGEFSQNKRGPATNGRAPYQGDGETFRLLWLFRPFWLSCLAWVSPFTLLRAEPPLPDAPPPAVASEKTTPVQVQGAAEETPQSNGPLPANPPQTTVDAAAAVDPAAKAALATRPGAFVRITFPPKGNIEDSLKARLEHVARNLKNRQGRPVLVIELAADAKQMGAGTSFSQADSIAEILTTNRQLSGVRTVAFIPQSLKGHAVLAALACEEIIIAPNAELGAAGASLPVGEKPSARQLSRYAELAELRKTIPKPVALAMLDRDLRLLRVQTQAGLEYVLDGDLEKLKQTTAVDGEPVVLSERGEIALFSGKTCRENGFASYLASTREEVVSALEMDSASLERDPALMCEVKAIQIAVHGAITPEGMRRTIKSLKDQLTAQSINFICVRIDSPGGAPPQHALDLAETLSELDSDEVMSVAFIPRQALADAALIALGCDEIVVGGDAVLGGQGAYQMSDADLAAAKPRLMRIARNKDRTWSLFAAMQAPNFEVFRFRRVGTTQTVYLSDEEYAQRTDNQDWRKEEAVTTAGEQLILEAKQVLEFGLTRHEFASDMEEFKRVFSLPSDPALVEPGWATAMLEALASPSLSWVLLMVGFAALWAELHSPGLGLGGFIAGVCFLLFFWGQYLQGTAIWLEGLLFLAGLICLLVEFFVVPGATIFGVGGALLMLSAVILSTQTGLIPQNGYQLLKFRNSLLTIMAAIGGTLVFALLANRILPHTPFFKRVILAQSEEEKHEIAMRESLAEWEHLLGKQGVTTTALRPSGKARFGDDWVDVLTRGEAIELGQTIEVVEVRGSRVIVRAFEEGSILAN